MSLVKHRTDCSTVVYYIVGNIIWKEIIQRFPVEIF